MKYFLLTLLFSFNVFASYIIPDGGVTTAKIANNAVTQAKRAALGQQLSSSSGTFSSTSTSAVDVTNLTDTITTTGRPVSIQVIPDGTNNPSQIYYKQNTEQAGMVILLLRDGSVIARTDAESNLALSGGYNYQNLPASLSFFDAGASATSHVYKIQAYNKYSGSVQSFGFSYCKLLVFEL